jgi:hypothetical protein
MAFNHENLKVYQRTLPFNVKVGAWTGQWDSKHAIGDQFRHDRVNDRRSSTMRQSTKLATKLATKKRSPGSARNRPPK